MLLTYRSHVSPIELLTELENIYEAPQNFVKYGATVKVKIVRARVASLVRDWMATGVRDFQEDKALLQRLVEEKESYTSSVAC